MKKIKAFITSRDEIAPRSIDFLHYEGDDNLKTFSGGFVSLTLYIYLIYIFTVQGINLVKKSSPFLASLESEY
jgi:hypothetical protein